MKYCLCGVLCCLSACSVFPSAEERGAYHSGLHFEQSAQPVAKGLLVRVAGSSTVFGGDFDQEFARATRAAADQQHCAHYRVDDKKISQENTLLGTRQVAEGVVRCE